MASTNSCNHAGFVDQAFPPGSHICQIYSDEQERLDWMMGYVESSLRSGAKAACFTERPDEASFAAYLKEHGYSMQELQQRGALTKASAGDFYFPENRFDPESMLEHIRGFYQESRDQGFSAARGIGEIVPEVTTLSGGERLMEYEAQLNQLLKECPITTVCQYNVKQFTGAMIMQALKVHPWMVIRGSVVYNPYYVSPEEYLAQNQIH